MTIRLGELVKQVAAAAVVGQTQHDAPDRVGSLSAPLVRFKVVFVEETNLR
jgi:hypothetical protein